MVKAFPLNQQEYSYNAQDVSYYYAGRHSGVFDLDTNCKVSVVSGMDIKVSKGKGWLAHKTDLGIVFWMEEDINLSVPVGDTASPRWDYVCVGWETAEVKKNPTVYIKSGSPAVTPIEPKIENSADKIEICLAKIYVPSGTTNLLSDGVVITDTRADKAYCGLVGDDLRTTNLEERATSLERRTTSLEGRADSLENSTNDLKSRTSNLESGATLAGEASKAKKLSNQITINGTNFDGSSSITTAKWGVARNIFTPKGKISFDGSTDLELDFLWFEKLERSGINTIRISPVPTYRIKSVFVRVTDVKSYSTVTIQVERKTTSSQIVIFPDYPMSSTTSEQCRMIIVDKGSGYADVKSYEATSGFVTANIIIIDVPFGI